jgi:glycosyltransferase involved in cell wall biosynthesis
MKILTLTDAYLPAYKYGGPVRSISAMVEQLPPSLQFWIVTRDRDLGDTEPFPGIAADRWTRRGRALVHYTTAAQITTRRLARLVDGVGPDVVYANGIFSRLTIRFLIAKRLGMVSRVPLVLAPRGELSPGALPRKTLKKRVFLEMVAGLGLLESVVWQASTVLERDEIIATIEGLRARASRHVCVARNLSSANAAVGELARPKSEGSASFVFVSRIVPKKNLLWAIQALARVRGDVTFDVYGPIEDPRYWFECTRAADALPSNVRFSYRGEARPDDVSAVFGRSHFFVFPTFSENFGHVIVEALTAGCPVVLSDQTPWKDLRERRAGWSLPLASLAEWSETLQACTDMSHPDYLELSDGAARAAAAYTNPAEAIAQNVAMFDRALELVECLG